ncbi:hypothetical protein RRG55_01980 [Mycoplasmopsis felis]|uniref:discoidin domain-containing protein n=2 Tax=Mycoplasmopsis felis TaxID=33923 RepID=UPI002AFF4AE4|nr:hypothetical protein [Mycoplasmopsis felis]WQQ04287.1 hypothetical protein RRG47_01810 [Mycoplasmopsis felis]
MSKKTKLIIGAVLGGAILAGGITAGIVLSSKKDSNESQNKKKLNTNIENSKSFKESLSDPKYSEIKNDYDALVSTYSKYLTQGLTDQEYKNHLDKFNQELNKLKARKQSIDNAPTTNKQKLVDKLAKKVTESKEYLTELENSEYKSIKDALSSVISEVEPLVTNNDNVEITELNSKLNKLNDALTKAKQNKQSFDQEKTAKATKTEELKTKISEVNEFLNTLTNDKYNAIKTELTTAKTNAETFQTNIASKTSSEINAEIIKLNNVLTKAKSDKDTKDAEGITFSAANASFAEPSSTDEQSEPKYKLVSFELTGSEALDELDSITKVVVDNNVLSIESKTFKNETEKKVITVSFKVFENKTYSISGIQYKTSNEVKSFTPLTIQVSGFQEDPEVPENVTVENNLNTIEIPLNNVHEGLSPVISDDKVVELSSNTYYLYLIKGEKVDKYLPKKIKKDGKLYNIPTNINQTSLAVTDVQSQKFYEKDLSVVYTLSETQETNEPQNSDTNSLTVMFKVGFVDYNVEAKTHIYNNKLDIDEENSNDALKRHNETNHQISTLINNDTNSNNGRWHNWNDFNTDQSNYKNYFTFVRKNMEETFLINSVDLYLKAANMEKFVLPKDIKILVSDDGQTYTEVQHQDKILHSDFGTENNENVLTSGFTYENSSVANLVKITFEPTFAKYIRLRWTPRELNDSTQENKKHYAWQISEIKFYDINNKNLDSLKSTYIDKTKEKESILTNISSFIEKFKNISDVDTKRYSLIIQKADDILRSFTSKKESIKKLDGEKFKEKTKSYLDKIKELNVLLMSANSQNTTKDKGIEVALKSARETLSKIYTFLNNTPKVISLQEKITKSTQLFNSLDELINSDNKTKTSIFDKVLEVNTQFKEIEDSVNMIKNSETLLSINNDSIKVKAKENMNNAYEVSMDLTIHTLKEQENQSLKLKLNQDDENITITDIQYNDWSVNARPSNSDSQPSNTGTQENPTSSDSSMQNTPTATSVDTNSESTLPVTKKITFTITNTSSTKKTINLKEILLGETKIIELTDVPSFEINGQTTTTDMSEPSVQGS